MPPNGRKKQKSDNMAAKETIHSGHFMVSDIDDPETNEHDACPSMAVHESDCDQDTPSQVQGFDFESACQATSKTYTFGPRSSQSISIDASLTKLFECMTLAYSGKLTSPRWKQFKGLKLRLKEKIRLNNIIWRAWHIQFVSRRKPSVCQFSSLDAEVHCKPEAVVIEGKYWKRRMCNVTAEYIKWRSFYKDRFKLKASNDLESMAVDVDYKWLPPWSNCSNLSGSSLNVDDDLFMDFSDTLFSTLIPNQPFDFPNPREIAARAGIADFIQPGLVQLQPALEDFMDTFEPLQDFLSSRLPTLHEENSESPIHDILPPSQNFASSSSELNPFQIRRDVSSVQSHSQSEDLFSQSQEQNQQVSLNAALAFEQPQQQDIASSGIEDGLLLGALIKPRLNSSHKGTLQDISSGCSSNQQSAVQSSVQSTSSQVTCIGGPPEVTLAQTNEVPMDSILSSSLHTVSTRRPTPPISTFNSTVSETASTLRNKQSNRTFSISSHHSDIQNQLAQTPHQPVKISIPHPQVPLSSITPQQSSSQQSTPTSSQIFLALNAAAQQQTSNPNIISAPFTIPVHVANAVPSQIPVTQSHIGMTSFQPQTVASVKSEASGKDICNIVLTSTKPGMENSRENATFRRHSYTGQQLSDGRRRSGVAPILPATTSTISNIGARFVVPEVPNKQRVRARSVSSPQTGSPKTIQQPPPQSFSLSNISMSPSPPLVPLSTNSICGSATVLAGPSTPQNATVLPQNAVLAQLLTSGSRDRPTVASVSNNTSQSITPSTVAIISSIPALATTTTQTFVISPVPIATVAGVNDFQRGLLVGAANQVFGNQTTNQCIFPSPSSSPSSPIPSSSSPALGNPSPETSATSPVKPYRTKSYEERVQYKEHRRVCHINAEQKRRCNIKNGFEALRHLLPSLSQNPNAKVSKAAMLQKSAEYIRTLKAERHQQQEEMEILKQQIEALNQAISVYQNQLPATGAPVPCQRTNRLKEMFEDYVKQQTLQNWKFWIFSLLLEPLLETYNSNVSTSNVEELCRTILSWLDQHCSLVALRPGVLNSLRHLSTTTNILSDPSRMPEEATHAVTKKEITRQ